MPEVQAKLSGTTDVFFGFVPEMFQHPKDYIIVVDHLESPRQEYYLNKCGQRKIEYISLSIIHNKHSNTRQAKELLEDIIMKLKTVNQLANNTKVYWK